MQRAIDVQVDQLAARSASMASRRELKRTFRLVLDFAPELIDREVVVDAICAVAFPASPLTANQRHLADTIYDGILLEFMTIKHLSILKRETQDVLAFWTWAGHQMHLTLQDYVMDQPRLADLPDVGHFFEAPELSSIMNSACSSLSKTLGGGISVLQGRVAPPPGREPPPTIGAFGVDN
jgi:hypothetical protein